MGKNVSLLGERNSGISFLCRHPLNSFKSQFYVSFGGGVCVGGAGCPWVAGWLGVNGGRVSIIAICSGSSCRTEVAVAGAAPARGSAPARDEAFIFVSLFSFLICKYV